MKLKIMKLQIMIYELKPWIKSKNQNYEEGFERKLHLFTGDKKLF